jgi:DNA polymerase (family 10)
LSIRGTFYHDVMNNQAIAAVLEQIADLLEFQNSNPFRVRAYRGAARRIQDFSEPLSVIVADGDRNLTDLDGIGKEMAAKIVELLQTGKLSLLEELREQVPDEVFALLRIPGLGPKKAAVLYNELGIASLEMLRAACESQQVRTLKGFGAKTEETILAGIPLAEQAGKRIYWAEADNIARQLLTHIRGEKSIRQIEFAGSYRRGRETVGDLDLLVDASPSGPVMDRLAEFDGVSDILARGGTKMSVRLESGLQIDLRVVPTESFGAALQYFTGSKDHNVVLRGMAKDRGLKINEYGVYRVDKDLPDVDGESLAGRTEEDVYAVLELPCFPPEIRESRQEFHWAKEGKLPELIELDDIVGDLHMHTTTTDGKATLREMAAAARDRGLHYIAITDHSKRVSMARGLDEKRLRRQWKEVDQLNDELDGLLVLKGIECDVLEKGGMDLPDDVLAEADWVVASLHYGQNQPRAQIMARLLEAIEHPHVSIIGHPTGRLINRREPYDVDIEQIIVAAAEQGKLLELNANPARLDLNDVHLAAASRHHVPVVISTDAHSIAGLDVMRYGVLQARRAGLTRNDVANTLPWEQVCRLIGNV